MNRLSRYQVTIVTHESKLPCIPGEDLKNYLLQNKAAQTLFISHPLLYIKDSYERSSRYELLRKTKLVKKSTAFHWQLPEPLLYVKDFFYTIIWSIKMTKRCDIFFGIDGLNALAGLFLKLLGRVDKVIFYTIDLFPQRFDSPVMNWIYHTIDRICVRFSDETWNVSVMMAQARQNSGMVGPSYSRQYTAPIGIWFDRVKRQPFSKIDQTKLVYIGHLTPFMGVDLAIKAFPKIIKAVPSARLDIIGAGEDLDRLVKLTNQLKLQKYISFLGQISKEESEKMLANCAIGLATFNTNILDDKVKRADPAKIKDYMLAGLPVIVTDAISTADKIAKAQAGLVVKYHPDDLAQAVIALLKDPKTLQKLRQNAIKYVQQFDWNNIFSQNLNRIL